VSANAPTSRSRAGAIGPSRRRRAGSARVWSSRPKYYPSRFDLPIPYRRHLACRSRKPASEARPHRQVPRVPRGPNLPNASGTKMSRGRGNRSRSLAHGRSQSSTGNRRAMNPTHRRREDFAPLSRWIPTCLRAGPSGRAGRPVRPAPAKSKAMIADGIAPRLICHRRSMNGREPARPRASRNSSLPAAANQGGGEAVAAQHLRQAARDPLCPVIATIL
jgi:hypothetical protein